MQFSKSHGNVRKHSDIKLVTTKARRNYFVSEPNYYTTKEKTISKNVLATEMKKRRTVHE